MKVVVVTRQGSDLLTASTTGEAGAGTLADEASVAALAAAFARAAGGRGGGGKGRASAGREERYYEEGDEGNFTAVSALTDDQVRWCIQHGG